MITDSAGNNAQTLYYQPFGEIRVNNKTGTYDEKRKYTGHLHDDETNLEFMEARYYNAQWGRFTSEDPLFLQIGANQESAKLLADPQSQNSYAYARNNPLKYVDPDGRFWEEISAFGQGLLKGAAYVGGLAYGAGESAVNLVGGTLTAAINPVDTVVSTYHAVTHLDQVWDGITKEATARVEAISHMQDSVESAFNAGRGVGKTAVEVCVLACSAAIKVPDWIGGGKASLANRFNHIFGNADHNLGSLVKKFGSEEKAFNAVQSAANDALKAGKLTPNEKGILPSRNGNIINVAGMDVRLTGGYVQGGKIRISSFTRQGL